MPLINRQGSKNLAEAGRSGRELFTGSQHEIALRMEMRREARQQLSLPSGIEVGEDVIAAEHEMEESAGHGDADVLKFKTDALSIGRA